MKINVQINESMRRVGKLIASSLLYWLMLSILFQGCKETCDTQLVTYFEPNFSAKSSVVKTAELESPQSIENAGKIYYKDDYLFINEVDKGIHVIDNRDHFSPKVVSFIDLPGNKDLAALGNFLYADNYTDLVVLDISDKNNIHEVNRIENVFDTYYYLNAEDELLISYTEIQEEVEIDCGNGPDIFVEESMLYSSDLSSNLASNSSGIGGSLARFTVTNNFLYTINDYRLKLFDVSINDSPVEGKSVELGWGIETIFPYEDKLFFGARSGMHIYDNSIPSEPTYISTYEHINTCDPVVVQGDVAYVTLRSGTTCETFTNQLDVLDISDLKTPQLIATHEMQNPHGLGIKGECLFIAEGDYGLKVFNATDPSKIGDRLTAHHSNVHALDVIPLDDVLFMIGNDGLHQYQYDCKDKFTYMSTISF